MAESQDKPANAGKAPKYRKSKFVSEIAKDPKQLPNVLLLSGYLGDSSEEDHARLYLDPEFDNYVEIPNEGILYTQDIPEEELPLGGSYVWIEADADLTHGKVGTERHSGKFLQGQILQAYQNLAKTPDVVGEQSGAKAPFHPTPSVTLAQCCGPITQQCSIPPQCPIGPTAWYRCTQMPPHCPIGPTGMQHCTQPPVCPPIGPTVMQHCTQIGCPLEVQQAGAGQMPTLGLVTSPCLCPPSIGCPPTTPPICQGGQAGAAQGVHVGPTGIYQCTQSPPQCGNTAWQGCTQAGCASPGIGCTVYLTCPPTGQPAGHTECFGCTTPMQQCPPALSAPPNCPSVQPCHTVPPFCPQDQAGAAQMGTPVGPTGVQNCTQSPPQCGNTAWRGCTQAGCGVGVTGVQNCTQGP